MTLVGQADLADFSRLGAVLRYLADLVPFQTGEELADHADASSDLLGVNRSALIAADFLETMWEFVSPWPMVNSIYPLKRFNRLEIHCGGQGEETQSSDGIGVDRTECVCTEFWSRPVNSTTKQATAVSSSTSTHRKKAWLQCTCDKAQVIERLNEAKAKRLASGRSVH